MKDFVFKLQTALDIKLREEDLHKEKLAGARKVLEDNLRILSDLQFRLDAIMNLMRGKQAERVDVQAVRSCQEFLPILRGRLKAQEIVVEQCRQEAEAINRELIEIMRRRKILEKLKDRHYQTYMLEFRREEQKEIDEMATAQYFRKDSGL